MLNLLHLCAIWLLDIYQVRLVFVSRNCLCLLRTIPRAVSSQEPLARKQTLRVAVSTNSFHFTWRAAIKLCNIRKPTGFAMKHLKEKKPEMCGVQYVPQYDLQWIKRHRLKMGFDWVFSDNKIIQIANLVWMTNLSTSKLGTFLDSRSSKLIEILHNQYHLINCSSFNCISN